MSVYELEYEHPILKDKLTVLSSQKELLKSQYGVTSYLKWCRLETQRIGNCALFTADGLCCVIPNDPTKLLPVEGVA